MVDMPKNLKRNCPEKVKTMSMMKEIMVALLTMRFRSSLPMPFVMVRKTGIVPRGLVSVKNDVKHSRANVITLVVIVFCFRINYNFFCKAGVFGIRYSAKIRKTYKMTTKREKMI